MFKIISFTTVLAGRLTLLKWRHVLLPTQSRWIKDVLHYNKREEIRFSLKGLLRNFEKTLSPVLDRDKGPYSYPKHTHSHTYTCNTLGFYSHFLFVCLYWCYQFCNWLFYCLYSLFLLPSCSMSSAVILFIHFYSV